MQAAAACRLCYMMTFFALRVISLLHDAQYRHPSAAKIPHVWRQGTPRTVKVKSTSLTLVLVSNTKIHSLSESDSQLI